MGRIRILACALAVAAASALLTAPGALATFHLIKVREVYPGSALAPEAEYVELQMYAGGQNHVAGHKLRTYGASGEVLGTTTFASDVAGGANQSTILLATAAAEAQFGVAADVPLASPGSLSPAGGALCWEELDCVSWGSFAGSLPSPAGTPAAAIPDGQALQRRIDGGCATLLENSDDTNDSASDFAAAAPAPRPNSVPPSEQVCTSGSGGGGGGGGGGGSGPSSGGGTPQTTLRAKPAKRTHDRTPTFRFTADEPGVRFQCKLDGKPFRGCRSPFTSKRLAFGSHSFRVRSIDSDGKADPTPASYRFRVIPPRG
jgi:hypothetical protein